MWACWLSHIQEVTFESLGKILDMDVFLRNTHMHPIFEVYGFVDSDNITQLG